MKNNFDFLRLIFALFVVIAHSYPLSGNLISIQWIYQITNGQIELSNIGLNGFFIISGYLIFQSLERSKTFFSYLWKRVLRLFPALFVVLFLTIILAPSVYESTVPYMQNKDVFTYLPRNLILYDLQYHIIGVFDHNPYPSAINGSLWTICYEFSMYLLLGLLFFIKNNKVRFVLVLLAFLFMFFCYNFLMEKYGAIYRFGMQILPFFNLGTFFVAGALLGIVKVEIIKYKEGFLLLVFLVILVALYFNFYDATKHILLTLFVVLFGLVALYPISKINVIGDLSYGIYIYSFPIQQTLMYYFKLNTSALILFSVLIAMLFGYLSWHLIEKRMLVFKNKF
jgi:peptidoglycan/LPS O-acetylase OafA/YrhL